MQHVYCVVCSETVSVVCESGEDYDCHIRLFQSSLGNPSGFHLQCPKQVHVYLRGGKQIVCIIFRFSHLVILL